MFGIAGNADGRLEDRHRGAHSLAPDEVASKYCMFRSFSIPEVRSWHREEKLVPKKVRRILVILPFSVMRILRAGLQ